MCTLALGGLICERPLDEVTESVPGAHLHDTMSQCIVDIAQFFNGGHTGNSTLSFHSVFTIESRRLLFRFCLCCDCITSIIQSAGLQRKESRVVQIFPCSYACFDLSYMLNISPLDSIITIAFCTCRRAMNRVVVYCIHNDGRPLNNMASVRK